MPSLKKRCANAPLAAGEFFRYGYSRVSRRGRLVECGARAMKRLTLASLKRS